MRNLKLATIALALAGFCLAAYAAYETIVLPADKPVDVQYPARLAYFQAPASGAQLRRIDSTYTTSSSVTTTYATNYTYSITYTNALGTTTNTVDYSLEPLPPGLVYADYWTNTIITATTVTNWTTTVVSHTNALGTVSQIGTGLYGLVTNAYLPAGTQLITSGAGTAILEK